jgi:hypothetical protein
MSTDSGVQTAVGDGEWLFPAASPVFMVAFWIDTDTVEVDYLSSFPPRRSMHAGWIGLTSGITGVAGDTLAFEDMQLMNWWFMEHESNQKIVNDGFDFYDRVTFHVPTGAILKFKVFYTFP